ncbi:MAG: DNA cytosine methyltransferase [Butyricimonas paravirosa]
MLEPRVLHAAGLRCSQSRERVIFIGIRKSALTPAAREALMRDVIPDEYVPYPSPSHAYHIKNKGLMPPQTVGGMFAGLKEPEDSDDPAQKVYSKAKFMGTHCQGQTEVDVNGIGPTIRAEHHGNIEYRRLSKEHGGIIDKELKKGLKERRLTPRECALIQTFPLDYEFVIPHEENKQRYILSPSAAYKIIGNAVPPLLAYHIGKRIENLWDLYFEPDEVII